MSKNKQRALQDIGIDYQFDAMTYYCFLRKRIPEKTLSLSMSTLQFEHLSVTEIDNMFNGVRVNDDAYMHPGVTNRELRDPRIRQAYEELMILKKLIGANNER